LLRLSVIESIGYFHISGSHHLALAVFIEFGYSKTIYTHTHTRARAHTHAHTHIHTHTLHTKYKFIKFI